jgi:glycosyltransferase involved in cell wall biosynthesis
MRLGEKTRLAFVGINYKPEPTGIGPYTSGMAESLSRLGHEVSVVTANPHYPYWRVKPEDRVWKSTRYIAGVKVTRYRHYVPKAPRGLLRALSEITFGLRSYLYSFKRLDVVVLVSPALLASLLVMLKIKIFHPKVKIVTWVQDLYGLGVQQTSNSNSLVSRIFIALEKKLFQNSDSIVTIHKSMARAINQSYNVPQDKIRIVRNWTHIEPIVRIDPLQVRKNLGWEGRIVALHSGNMGQKQALENVIDAAKLSVHAHPNILFVLMGEGSERKRLSNLSQGLRNVQMLDPVADDIYFSALCAADYLLVNEGNEVIDMAFPSKLTSYFMSGTPVIAATNESSSTALEIKENVAGVVVAPMSPSELLQAIVEGQQKNKEMKLFSQNALRHANAQLRIESATSAFDSLIKLFTVC